MSKMNPPLRLMKIISGYKSIRNLKSDLHTYSVVITPGGGQADIYDENNQGVGSVTGATLSELVKKVKQGLLSFGVKFPVGIVANIPFAEFGIQTVFISPAAVSGTLVLSFNDVESSAIVAPLTASKIQTALRDIPELKDVTVVDNASMNPSFDVTLVNVPQDANLMEVVSNTLTGAPTTEVQKLTFNAVPSSGTFRLNYGAGSTTLLLFSVNAAAIQTQLRTIGALSAVTVSGDFGPGFDIAMTGVVTPTLISVTDNTLSNGSPVTTDVDVTTPYSPGSVVTAGVT